MPGWHEDGYLFRRKYRTAAQRWLAEMDVNFFATLTFRQNVGLLGARKNIEHWLACLDRHYLGRQWWKRPSAERTIGIGLAENVESNLHYHWLLRLPESAKNENAAQRGRTIERFWTQATRGGTCRVVEIRDSGAPRYAAKQLVRPGYADHFILASEFHVFDKHN